MSQLPELAGRVGELDSSQKIIALRKMGPRGAKAVQLLHLAGFTQVWNLTGGIVSSIGNLLRQEYSG